MRAFYQKRKMALARVNLREQAEAARELLMAGADSDTVEEHNSRKRTFQMGNCIVGLGTAFRETIDSEDRGEAAKKIRELMFGKYTKEQLEAAAPASE